MAVIQFDRVSKSYNRAGGRALLRNYLKHFLHKERQERFFALRGATFQVDHGESVALIGHNGAGKTTLLSLLAGVAFPDSGSVRVDGRIAALLELGSGFHPDLTGRENVYLNASLLGLTRKQVDARYDEIVEFSGVGDFMEATLRTYSSGMIMRLAFSVAANVDPDILIIDEVIAVGDRSFQLKCLEKIHEFRAKGKTMVCVSHASTTIQELCDRALWLDHGEIMLDGPIGDVVAAYQGQGAFRQGA
jgi:ABC-type polysaccharide/polyol phosphate transport system ATPase subunit